MNLKSNRNMRLSVLSLLLSFATQTVLAVNTQQAGEQQASDPKELTRGDSGSTSSVDPQFRQFMAMKADLFRGGAQGLSIFNLDIELVVRYKESNFTPGTFNFSLASNGNLHIHGVPVYVISGSVRSDLVGGIANSAGQILKPTGEGQVVGLSRVSNVAYLIESDLSLAQRNERINYFRSKGEGRFEPAKGRVIGIVKYYLDQQSISFYQMNENTGELIPSGEFKGLPVLR